MRMRWSSSDVTDRADTGAARIRGSRFGRQADDQGQVMLLTLIYTLIAFSLIIVAVDATAVHLARTQLWDAADAAALDASDAIDEAGTYGLPSVLPRTEPTPGQPRGGAAPGPGDVLELTDASVRERAAEYLSTYRLPSRLTDVHLGPGTGSPDGRGAQVELTGTVHIPIGGVVVAAWSDGITITVRSHAQARLH